MLVPIFSIDGIAALVRTLNSRKYQKEHENLEKVHDFTILIPVYNSSKYLGKTLENLENYKDKVLVVDDSSKDDSPQIAIEKGFKVKINPRNGNKIGAIRQGLEYIDSTYTVLMDSDTSIVKGNLEDLIGLMKTENSDACSIRIMPSSKNGLLEHLQRIEYAKAMMIGRGSMNGRKNALIPCISGAFGVFKTDILREITKEQINDSNSWEGEDFERTLRFIEKKCKVSHFDNFVGVTAVPTSLKDFTKQRIKWQEGYLRCHWKFKKMLLRKDKLGFTFLFNYIFNIIGHPFKIIVVPALVMSGIPFLVFLGFYFILETILSKVSLSREEWKESRKYILLMPFYGLYHLFIPTTIGYLKFILDQLIETDERKKFRLAKCPSCKHLTPYKLWEKDRETNEWISLKIHPVKCRWSDKCAKPRRATPHRLKPSELTAVRCKKCGTLLFFLSVLDPHIPQANC